jgi:DNA (cytosine-5)-methyltransferase 1
MKQSIKVASLFCGCGGSDLGLLGNFTYLGKTYRQLPYNITYAVDFDPQAVSTYNANFKHPAVCANVCNEDFSSIGDIDLVIGGFPCQSFSTVNPTKDTEDERAHLYKQIVRILREKQPKAFICENVKGLMTLKQGAIIAKIEKEFSDQGYIVKHQLIKAVEFGIPQRRERVIIVGIRKDIDFNYEFPKPITTEGEYVPLKKVIDKLDISNTKYYFSQRAVEGMKNAKNNMKRGLWQDLNAPCLTITSHLAKTSLNSRDPVLLVDPEKEIYRRFTPLEAARIQSFPDSFIFPVSETFAYKQIGNAIPPVLMWYIANSILPMFKK